MLVPEALGFIFRFVRGLVDFLEDVLKAAIITLQDSVFGAHIQWVISLESILETGVGEALDGGISVVHAEENTWTLEFVDFHGLFSGTTSWFKSHRKSTWLSWYHILCLILITKRMSADDNWLSPTGH